MRSKLLSVKFTIIFLNFICYFGISYSQRAKQKNQTWKCLFKIERKF